MVGKFSTYPWSHDKYCSKDCDSIDTSQKVPLVLRCGAGRGRTSQVQLTWNINSWLILQSVAYRPPCAPAWASSHTGPERVCFTLSARHSLTVRSLMTDCWGIGKGHLFRDKCICACLYFCANKDWRYLAAHWLLPAALQWLMAALVWRAGGLPLFSWIRGLFGHLAEWKSRMGMNKTCP